MVIRFLGTAAAEGVPAIFCNCGVCLKAKATGGKDIRTRSQIMVNDEIMIDFPPDTYSHLLTHRLDLSGIKSVFITHSHTDHCYPQELVLHGSPYAHNMTQNILSIYASKTVIKRSRRQIRYELRRNVEDTLRFNRLKPYDIITLEGIKITALPARHTKGENCFIYLVEDGKASYLQFNDSGILDDGVYSYLAKAGVKLNLVSYDCTYGFVRAGKNRHMGALDNADERKRMEDCGITDKNTVHVLTHFSHNSSLLHDEMEQKASGLGFVAAYDGYTIEI